ncbi:MAG TPA: SPOR domain-containing protein [Chitinispirillaceae bacterium]|nr:SPOR domain-containing protein [Chitinispirillaceae bacterium]
MNKKILIFSALVALMNCAPAVIDKNIDSTVEKDSDKPVPIVPETTPGVQQTFLDTLNQGNEIGLSFTDFGKEIRPTVIQTVEQSAAGLEVRYRIQMFASSSVETLREQKRMMETKVDLPFFLSYEPPFFKLFVGDFRSRVDAETYLSKIKKHGYPDAWIVTARSVSQN